MTRLDVLDRWTPLKVCVAYGPTASRTPAVPPVGVPRGHPGLRGAPRLVRPTSPRTRGGRPAGEARGYLRTSWRAGRVCPSAPRLRTGARPVRAVRQPIGARCLRGGVGGPGARAGRRAGRAPPRWWSRRATLASPARRRPPEEVEADLFVVGPEAPLVAGLADRLRAPAAGVRPGADGARLEGSKAWMKDVLDGAGVPTARSGPSPTTEPRWSSCGRCPAPTS